MIDCWSFYLQKNSNVITLKALGDKRITLPSCILHPKRFLREIKLMLIFHKCQVSLIKLALIEPKRLILLIFQFNNHPTVQSNLILHRQSQEG